MYPLIYRTLLSPSEQMGEEVKDPVEEADDPLPEAAGVIFATPFAFAVLGRGVGVGGLIALALVAGRRAGHGDIPRFGRIGPAADFNGDRIFYNLIGGCRCGRNYRLRRAAGF